ncbi:MAG: permease-like cell division protein FtsX [Chitinophagaceae bacterium]
MSQFGRASSKRGKPNYAYAIIGVALVLYLFGIVGWFFLNLRKTGDYFKENIQVQGFLNRDASKKKIDSVKNFVGALPYVKSIEYITKEMAVKRYEADNDTTWRKFIDNNPLPESIDFFVKASHVQTDSLKNISNIIDARFPGVISEFKYPEEIVSKVGGFAQNLVLGFLFAAILLTILVIISIDNTIRLAMYSNRFLIKTMQMVGATRWFIAKPINIRAIVNGLVASGIAIVLIWISVLLIEAFRPEFKVLRDNKSLILLFFTIIFVGITITLVSTHRAVIKYLKMKLDDLY